MIVSLSAIPRSGAGLNPTTYLNCHGAVLLRRVYPSTVASSFTFLSAKNQHSHENQRASPFRRDRGLVAAG